MNRCYTSPVVLRLLSGVLLIGVCAIFRTLLEADPVTHMLVQLPALAWAGWLIAGAASVSTGTEVFSKANVGGWAGLLVALYAILFWMLPRSIDGALVSPVMEIAKFLSVPILIGAPLRWSWHRAHPLLRGALKCNAMSMCGVLAWLYTSAPIRVCNNYLIDDQKRLGIAFLLVSLGLAVAWGGRVFFPPSRESATVSGNARDLKPDGQGAA